LLKNSFGKLSDFFFFRLYDLEHRLFDLYLGTSTTGFQLTNLDFFRSGSNNWPYQGCDWFALHRALSELRPTNDDVFVDLGSGKGRALLIAGRLPYGKAVGVELDPELAACARQNLEAARSKFKARLVQSEVSNALDWPIPEQVNTIFMFNPFFGETFRSMMTRVFDSYDQYPRRLHIVYLYPWEHDWLVSTGRVVVDNVYPGAWPKRKNWWESGNVIVTYHVVGTGDAASTDRCLPRAMNSTSKAMLRWSGPNGHSFSAFVPQEATSGLTSGPLTVVKKGDSVILSLLSRARI
jgi:SAM-dependent methyltransferase